MRSKTISQKNWSASWTHNSSAYQRRNGAAQTSTRLTCKRTRRSKFLRQRWARKFTANSPVKVRTLWVEKVIKLNISNSSSTSEVEAMDTLILQTISELPTRSASADLAATHTTTLRWKTVGLKIWAECLDRRLSERKATTWTRIIRSCWITTKKIGLVTNRPSLKFQTVSCFVLVFNRVFFNRSLPCVTHAGRLFN